MELRASSSSQPQQQQQQHNFNLFRWQKLLGVPSPIARVAVGGFKGHQFVAVLLQSNVLVLRYESDTALLVRHLPLPWEVKGLSFDRSAQWLLLVMDDLTLALLPAYFLMKTGAGAAAAAVGGAAEAPARGQQAAPAQSVPLRDSLVSRLRSLRSSFGAGAAGSSSDKLPFSDLQDVTVIASRGALPRSGATGCVWWWNAPRKKNVCITSYSSALSSAVVLLELDVPREEVAVRLRQGVLIRALSLLETAAGEAWLFVSTVGHGEWRMPLILHAAAITAAPGAAATAAAAGSSQPAQAQRVTIMDPGVDMAPFQLVSLMGRYPAASRLTPQVLRRTHQPDSAPTNVVSVYSGQTDKLLVLDESLGKFALYAYQVPPCAFEMLTDRIVFCVQQSTLSVVSCLFAGTSAQPHFSLRYSRDSLMQVLTTPNELPILGLLPSFPSASSGGGKADACLEGCIVFTQEGVFELVCHVDPRELFLEMVAKVAAFPKGFLFCSLLRWHK